MPEQIAVKTVADGASTVRIGIVGLRGIPGVMGGVESHVEQLYPRVKSLDPARTIVIAERKPYVDRTIRSYHGLDLLPLPAIRSKYLEAIAHTFIAIIALRMRGCRLIHFHGIGPGLLVPLARIIGMKIVFTHHGVDYQRAKWNRFAKWALRIGERVAVNGSDQTIVVSGSLARSLRQRFPQNADRIHFVPNGASRTFVGGDGHWVPEVLEKFELEPRQFILAVGRLVPEKGFRDLIEAVRRSGIRHKLVIVGRADHPDAYVRGLLAEASDQIVFAGFQHHDVLRSLYAATALFVLPSHHEGLPITALEAAAMNTPMLLSDISANLEIGLPECCYFETGSIDALAAKLKAPLSTFDIDGNAVIASFDWDAIARTTNSILNRAVAEAVIDESQIGP